MVSSTESEVDPSSPTIFDYHERDGMIWGEYEGDTVRIGQHGDGLRLVEDFRTADGDQVSVCAQISPGRAPHGHRSSG